jgi:hypothetical protein
MTMEFKRGINWLHLPRGHVKRRSGASILGISIIDKMVSEVCDISKK